MTQKKFKYEGIKKLNNILRRMNMKIDKTINKLNKRIAKIKYKQERKTVLDELIMNINKFLEE